MQLFFLIGCLFHLFTLSKAEVPSITKYKGRFQATCAEKSVFIKRAWFGDIQKFPCAQSKNKPPCKLDMTNNIRQFCLGKETCDVLVMKNILVRDPSEYEILSKIENPELEITRQCLKVFACGPSGIIEVRDQDGLFNNSRTEKSDSCNFSFPSVVKLKLWPTRRLCGDIRYHQERLKRSSDGAYEWNTHSAGTKIDISKVTDNCTSSVFKFRYDKLFQGADGTYQSQQGKRDIYDSGAGLMAGIGVCGVVIVIGLVILAWSRRYPPPRNSNHERYPAGEYRVEQGHPERAHRVSYHEASGDASRPSYVSAEHANSVPKSYWWSSTVNMGSQANSGNQFYTV